MLSILPSPLQRFSAVYVIDVENELHIPCQVMGDCGVPLPQYGEVYRWAIMEILFIHRWETLWVECAYPIPEVERRVLLKIKRWIVQQPPHRFSRLLGILTAAPLGFLEEILVMDRCLCFCYEGF